MQINTIEEVMYQLNVIFRNVFDDENLRIYANTSAQDIKEWDSLTHIRLVISIEKYFEIRFSASEISELKNLSDMSNLILFKKQKL